MILKDLNIKDLLYEILEDERVFDDGIDLIDCGIMDSYTFIELFSRLEDYGVFLQPTRIDRSKLRSIKGIELLIDEYKDSL